MQRFLYGANLSEEKEKISGELTILKNELGTKIEENERVHVMMFDLRTEHQKTTSMLQNKLEDLKNKVAELTTR